MKTPVKKSCVFFGWRCTTYQFCSATFARLGSRNATRSFVGQSGTCFKMRLMVDHRSKNQLESCGSYSKSFLMDPQNKNQEKGPGIRTRHWHWHWLCFSAFFHWGGLPPPNEKNEKNKANANANAWFLFQVLFPGSYCGGRPLIFFAWSNKVVRRTANSIMFLSQHD